MVILFKGTDVSENGAPQALAVCAGISANKFMKKTLVMQLTTKYGVEDYVIGKKIKDQKFSGQMYLFEDSGIDSLTRRAEITTINETHFANAVIPCVNLDNMFDILEKSKKLESDVVNEIINKPNVIGTIIKAAKKIYDHIFILVDGQAQEVVEVVLPFIDKTVTCVSQGNKENISAKSTDKHYYLVTDFDYKSTYSARYMQRVYGVKKMTTMSYNVELRDYCRNQNLIQFILRNTDVDKDNYNYRVMSELTSFTKGLIETEEVENDELRCGYKRFLRYVNTPIVIDENNCQIEETSKKFFSPAKKKVHINLDDQEETQVGKMDRKEA